MSDIALRDIVAFLARRRRWLLLAVLLGAAGNLGWGLLAPGGTLRLERVDAVVAVSLPHAGPVPDVVLPAAPFMDHAQVVALLGSRRLAAAVVAAPGYADAMQAHDLGREARVEQLMQERRSLREDRATGLVHLQVRAPTTAAALRIARAHVEMANALVVADATRTRHALLAAVERAPARDRLVVEWRALEATTIARSVDLLGWNGERPPLRAVDLVPQASTPVQRAEMAAVLGLAGAIAGALPGLLLALLVDRVRSVRNAPRRVSQSHAG